jgi:hypothetical protein
MQYFSDMGALGSKPLKTVEQHVYIVTWDGAMKSKLKMAIYAWRSDANEGQGVNNTYSCFDKQIPPSAHTVCCSSETCLARDACLGTVAWWHLSIVRHMDISSHNCCKAQVDESMPALGCKPS